jgi:hypothetical protein
MVLSCAAVTACGIQPPPQSYVTRTLQLHMRLLAQVHTRTSSAHLPPEYHQRPHPPPRCCPSGELYRTPFADWVELVALGSRKNLCVNDQVLRLGQVQLINERCMELQRSKSSKAAATGGGRARGLPDAIPAGDMLPALHAALHQLLHQRHRRLHT